MSYVAVREPTVGRFLCRVDVANSRRTLVGLLFGDAEWNSDVAFGCRGIGNLYRLGGCTR